VYVKPGSKLPFITLSKTMLSISKPLELLHMDLFGPTSSKSNGGNLYCLVIVDDYSRYTWTLFLGDKSESPEIFKTFARRAQREYNSQIMKIRSDNDSEFKNMNIEDWCDKEGVKLEFSATYTPQQNGVVEHKNKTLITLARAMLDDCGTPERFWAEAINTVCHATNRVYLHRLLEKTPYELLVGRKPNISYFRVFGSYRVFNKMSGQVEETCDAEFNESNGSQGQVVGYDHVGDEEVQEALKNMSIRDIKPQVREASTSSTTHSMKPNVDEEDKEVPPTHPRVQVPSTQVQDQVDPIVQSSSQV
jgi:hypothetical protein